MYSEPLEIFSDAQAFKNCPDEITEMIISYVRDTDPDSIRKLPAVSKSFARLLGSEVLDTLEDWSRMKERWGSNYEGENGDSGAGQPGTVICNFIPPGDEFSTFTRPSQRSYLSEAGHIIVTSQVFDNISADPSVDRYWVSSQRLSQAWSTLTSVLQPSMVTFIWHPACPDVRETQAVSRFVDGCLETWSARASLGNNIQSIRTYGPILVHQSLSSHRQSKLSEDGLKRTLQAQHTMFLTKDELKHQFELENGIMFWSMMAIPISSVVPMPRMLLVGSSPEECTAIENDLKQKRGKNQYKLKVMSGRSEGAFPV
jgi:hypothetical protein